MRRLVRQPHERDAAPLSSGTKEAFNRGLSADLASSEQVGLHLGECSPVN